MSMNEKNDVSKLKVGIRYCGGCNPRYDRAAAVNRIKERRADCSFENAREGEKYDTLLVVGGCSACCASYEQFESERLVKIWSEQMGLESFGMD